MNREQLELWQRISSFSFDDPDSALPFSRRLAKENNWTHGFAKRVLEEYRRFVFLAVAAGHPVSPSDQVDQAWHLHLQYSESYWQAFCEKTLRRPLHHQPSRGGPDEQNKFDDWYERTLTSYETFFLEKPPIDIWPSAATRKKEDGHYLRVSTQDHWLIRMPSFWEILVSVGICGMLALFLAEYPSPLNLTGEGFLGFYLPVLGMTWVVALLLRRRLSEVPHGNPLAGEQLNPYEVAYLAAGGVMTVNAALSSMIKRQSLAVVNDGTALQTKDPLPADAHPIETVLYQAAAGRSFISVAELRPAAAHALSTIAARLEGLGLYLSDEQAARARRIPLITCFAVILFGFAKMTLGVVRDRPVGFLIFTMLVASVFFLISFARRPTASRAGAEVLAKLRLTYSRLTSLNTTEFESAAPTLLALAVGLFGLGVMEQTAFADLKKQLTPIDTTSSSGGCDGGCDDGCDGGCDGGYGDCNDYDD